MLWAWWTLQVLADVHLRPETHAISYAHCAGLSLVEAKLARARARRLASTIPTQNSNLDFVEHLQRRALKKRPDYVSQNIAKVRRGRGDAAGLHCVVSSKQLRFALHLLPLRMSRTALITFRKRCTPNSRAAAMVPYPRGQRASKCSTTAGRSYSSASSSG